MTLRLTPEQYEAYERKRVTQIGRVTQAQKTEMAATWNGNVEPIQIKAGAAIRKDAGIPGPHTPVDATHAPSKFRNVKTDGYASRKEAKRASDLRLMQEAGQISNLREQVEYELIPKQDGERACSYRADFVYTEFGGREVVEDAKGYRTPDYVIKRKLMRFVHGIRISEV